MKDLIARYDAGVRGRIVDIVKSVSAQTGARPSYVYDVKSLKILPPIVYPTSMVNVAVNYAEHATEMGARDASVTAVTPPGAAAPGTTSMPGIWQRKADDK